MSEFKTNKISPRKGTTTTIGDSGDSVSTSSGSTINNAGTITTAGITGGTINNTTGEIYLRGEVDWKPGDIKTASFTATDNQGFFVNTTSGEITVTLPASPSAGDVVGIKDYANTFDTNKCILNANGNKIQGSTTNFIITVEGSSIIIIYVDSTKGWVITDASKAADITEDIKYVTATGGTITTCGDFKIHSFTGPGTFCVSCGGNSAGNDKIDYLVIAGGGGGGNYGAGAGAGGFRESRNPDNAPAWTASPLASTTSLTLPATAYPVTVGGGGAGGPGTSCGTNGSNSVLSTITSAGGGLGSTFNRGDGGDGGSGGGGARNSPGSPSYLGPGGSGNTPPVSPPQGNNGGTGSAPGSGEVSGGGGGAGAAGGNGSQGPTLFTGTSGSGGNGVTTSINASPVTRAGGGGGSGATGSTPSKSYNITRGTGGSGGGGNGATTGPGSAGSANTGSGGGGGGYCGNSDPGTRGDGGTGGSGIVIIRYKYQN
jgi:hypothetical protein